MFEIIDYANIQVLRALDWPYMGPNFSMRVAQFAWNLCLGQRCPINNDVSAAYCCVV